MVDRWARRRPSRQARSGWIWLVMTTWKRWPCRSVKVILWRAPGWGAPGGRSRGCLGPVGKVQGGKLAHPCAGALVVVGVDGWPPLVLAHARIAWRSRSVRSNPTENCRSRRVSSSTKAWSRQRRRCGPGPAGRARPGAVRPAPCRGRPGGRRRCWTRRCLAAALPPAPLQSHRRVQEGEQPVESEALFERGPRCLLVGMHLDRGCVQVDHQGPGWGGTQCPGSRASSGQRRPDPGDAARVGGDFLGHHPPRCRHRGDGPQQVRLGGEGAQVADAVAAVGQQRCAGMADDPRTVSDNVEQRMGGGDLHLRPPWHVETSSSSGSRAAQGGHARPPRVSGWAGWPAGVADVDRSSTAQAATASTALSACRRPRRCRGSASWARWSSRMRHWSGGQRGGRDPHGPQQGWGMMGRQARRSGLVMGFDTHMIAGGRACSTSIPPTHPTITSQISPHFPRPWVAEKSLAASRMLFPSPCERRRLPKMRR
jgi:hypothetical protein